MKYLEFDNAYGRLSNHFYWLLLAHKYSKIFNEPVKFIKNMSYYNFKLENAYKKFNLDYLAEDRINLTKTDIVYKNTSDPIRRYHQKFFIDFTIEDIESFVNDTFIKTSYFLNCIYNDKTLAIHIRNGDYVNDKGMDIFDRKNYIKLALERVKNNNYKKLIVYSDNNKLNRDLYDSIFKAYFKEVEYVENTTGIEDFINFAKTKNKILWNSTFSYWAAFIGNVIYKDSYSNVIAPSLFGRTDPIGDHVNPLWNIININYKN